MEGIKVSHQIEIIKPHYNTMKLIEYKYKHLIIK